MSARLERQRRRRRSGGAARVIIITLTVLVACMVIGVLSAIGYVVGIANSAPDLQSLRPQDPGNNTVVYASDGQKLGTIQNDVLRTVIKSSDMPQNVRDATVAIEDQRFYQHKGVDFEGVIRAALKNATSGKAVQGGSTLTMQLIRNIYASGTERTFKRKVREAKLAEELENIHPGRAGKEWILTKYLNSVPYGTNGGQTAVGIQAAARAYFDKPASKLTLPEAALLAGLPQAPSSYNPFKEPGRAIARRNDVLRKMQSEGYISNIAAAAALQAPLELKSNGYFQQKRESYFFDYVTDELIKEYGVKTVRSGGLAVKTTIDLGLQEKARAAIKKSLNFPGAPSSAIVSIDPSNGYIRTMASSAKYAQSKFNLAADAERQPGSSFKVMALVAAVNMGVNPTAVSYPSAPFNETVPKYGPIDVNCYGGHCAGGSKNLVQATLTSDNGVYIRLALDVGPEKVKAAARGLGISSEIQGYPAETLGGLKACCTPLEMADAYATIASGGWRNKPKAITEVKFPDGKIDDLSKPIRHKAFDSAAMYTVTKILEQNIQSGTGTRANIGCPAAGKTGTTNENRNAWFVGFTPHLATSTWIGYPKNQLPMATQFHGGPVDGGTFPAEIWGNYMKAAKGKFCGEFPKPDHAFKTKPFKARHGGGGSLAPTNSFPTTTVPKKDPGTGTTKPGAVATPGGVKPPATTPPPPPPPATGGFDPGNYQAPPADQTPAPNPPAEQVATPP